MSIDLVFFKPTIFFKIFNYGNKSNPSISKKCYHVLKIFQGLSILFFKNVQSSNFNFLT